MARHRRHLILCLKVLHANRALGLHGRTIRGGGGLLVALFPEVGLAVLEAKESVCVVFSAVVVILEWLQVLEDSLVLAREFDFRVLVD